MSTFTIDPATGQNYVDGQPVAPDDPRLHQPFGGQYAGQGLSIPQMQLKSSQSFLDQGDTRDAAGGLPWDYTIDQGTGQIREKTWWEKNGETAKFLGGAAATLGGGFALSGLNGAAPTLEDSLNSGVNATTAGAGGPGVPGTIPSAFGSSAVDTTSSAAPGAAAGLPNWLKSAKDIGNSLQSYGYGRALGRVAEGTAQQNQARTADELYNSQLNAPGKIASNSVRGDILANARDVSIAAPSDIPVPTISGGLRPSMFSPTTRATGAALTQNASQDAANLRPAVPPTLPDLQGANGLDSVLNTAGLVSNIAGSVPKNIWSKIFGA